MPPADHQSKDEDPVDPTSDSAAGGKADGGSVGRADGQRREAFARLFAQHDRWLFSYLVVLLGSPADAEDVFQEVCVVLWREHEKFQLGTDFVSWVSVIANNQVYRYRAKSKRKSFPLDEGLLGEVADAAIGRADIFELRRDALRKCLGKLSPADRQIVQQCYDHESKSFKSAAERLGRPVNTVYKALNRIRRLLHECIDQTLATEGLQ